MVRLSERLRLRPQRSSGTSLTAEPPQAAAVEPREHDALPRDLSRELAAGAFDSEEHGVSRRLFERLESGLVEQARSRLLEDPDFQAHWAASTDPATRRMLLLHAAVWHGDHEVTDTTGLRPDQPPENIHAMARGPLAAAGGLYEADLVADALGSAGVQVAEIQRGLDFGCSSGRVARVLAAAYPEVEWLGCDPNADAVAWASDHLPGIRFFVSGNEPPLELADGSIDFAYAISIWSHFEVNLGLRWFDEMHRVLMAGGHLVITTHGLTSVAHYAGNGLRVHEQCEEIAHALYRRGWWYAPEFGTTGDWGVVNPAWGTAFVTPEWILSELCPRWRIVEFAPGRNAGNQDVYVLQSA